MVLPGVAETTRVCTYDRPGTYAPIGEENLPSRSDPIAQPRTAPEVVADLHALLQAAEVPGPYVLAGHSWGDSSRDSTPAPTPTRWSGWSSSTPIPRGWRPCCRPSAGRLWSSSSRELGSDTVFPIEGYGDVETIGFGADNAVMREAVAATPLAPMPLAVLAHGRPAGLPENAQGVTAEDIGNAPAGAIRRPGHAGPGRPLHRRQAKAATTSTRINPSW